MNISNEIIRIFENLGVIEHGHFRLNSGLHSGTYLKKDDVSSHPLNNREFCRQIAYHFDDDNVEVVVGPALGAIAIAYEVAMQLNELKSQEEPEILFVIAAKTSEGFEIKPSMRRWIKDKRVLIIEDILTTGGSAARTVKAVREAGAASIVGVGALCNRGSVSAQDLGLGSDSELFCLSELQIPTYEPDKCPLCARGVPMNEDLGHGSKK